MFNHREIYCENCGTKNSDYLDEKGNLEYVCSFCKCSVKAKFQDESHIKITSRNHFFKRLTFKGLFCANCGKMVKGKLNSENKLLVTCTNKNCNRSILINYTDNCDVKTSYKQN